MNRRTTEEIKNDMVANHAAMGTDQRIKGQTPQAIPAAVEYQAKILILTAELAEVSSSKVERLTFSLLVCTIALVICTVGLVVLTIILAVLTQKLVSGGH